MGRFRRVENTLKEKWKEDGKIVKKWNTLKKKEDGEI